MTAATIPDPGPQWAIELWNKLRTQFLAFQDTLEEIIDKRAWEPMGYSSFHENYIAKMGDITLAVELRPHVVYQMLAEGLSVEQIAASVRGVGVDRVESLARQRQNGVPARHASLSTGRKWHNRADDDLTTVREHERKKPSEASTVHLEIGALKLKRLEKAAKKLHMSKEELAISAIDNLLDTVG